MLFSRRRSKSLYVIMKLAIKNSFVIRGPEEEEGGYGVPNHFYEIYLYWINIELISKKYLFLLFCTFCGLFYFVNKISVVVAMNGNM